MFINLFGISIGEPPRGAENAPPVNTPQQAAKRVGEKTAAPGDSTTGAVKTALGAFEIVDASENVAVNKVINEMKIATESYRGKMSASDKELYSGVYAALDHLFERLDADVPVDQKKVLLKIALTLDEEVDTEPGVEDLRGAFPILETCFTSAGMSERYLQQIQ